MLHYKQYFIHMEKKEYTSHISCSKIREFPNSDDSEGNTGNW